MGSGFLKKKKQARLLQEQFSHMQDGIAEKLEKIEVTGTAGNGLVSITINGANEMKHIKIKPECVDPEDIEGLEALVKAAYQDACTKLKDQTDPSNFSGMPDLSMLGL